jgi:hypothetical protein
MRLSLEIDPKAIARREIDKACANWREWVAANPVKARESKKQWAKRWRTEVSHGERVARYERNCEQWLANGRERERIFHIINEARGNGLSLRTLKIPGVRRPEFFMAGCKQTWEQGNRDGRAWASRAHAKLVKAVCYFMTHDGASFKRMADVLANGDDELTVGHTRRSAGATRLNPDPFYQEGWFNGVCQQAIPDYVVHSRFEQKPPLGPLHKCEICSAPFRSFKGLTCSPECSKEKKRRYQATYVRPKRKARRRDSRPAV